MTIILIGPILAMIDVRSTTVDHRKLTEKVIEFFLSFQLQKIEYIDHGQTPLLWVSAHRICTHLAQG